MYRVTIRQSWDGPELMIHSPHVNSLKIDNVDIGLDVATNSSLTFAIYSTNPGYNAIQYMATIIRVYDTVNQMDVFEGRALTVSDPLESNGMTYKTIACEGMLAWLRDSRPGFLEFDGKTRKEILTSLINAHNSQMTTLGAPYKCFKLGNIDMADTVAPYCFTDDKVTTYEDLETLVKGAGYELAVRHESDGLYIDCAKTIGGVGDQIIRLGYNLISFTRNINPSALASAYLPLGKAADPPATEADGSTEKGTARLTIASANDGSPLLRDDALLKQFGPIVGAQSFDDETDPAKLKTSGSKAFKSLPVATISSQLEAIDLTFVGKAKGPLLCGWTYRTLIPVKGIDDQLRITQMHININDVRTNTMTIGDRVVGQEEYNAQLFNKLNSMASIQTSVQQQRIRIGTINEELKTISQATDAVANKLSFPKSVIYLGDSITVGSHASDAEHAYPAVIAAKYGSTAINDGASGATIATNSSNDTIAFATRAKKIDWLAAEVVVVFGGTNDFGQALPIGTISDTTTTTVYGAINSVIKAIYASNPSTRIMIVSPLWRAIDFGGNHVEIETYQNSIGLKLSDYVEAERLIAARYHLPFIDAFDGFGINAANYTSWLADGLHPNDKGYDRLAIYIANFISQNM